MAIQGGLEPPPPGSAHVHVVTGLVIVGKTGLAGVDKEVGGFVIAIPTHIEPIKNELSKYVLAAVPHIPVTRAVQLTYPGKLDDPGESLHVHDHGPDVLYPPPKIGFPTTVPVIPVAQRLVVGAEEKLPPLDVPHVPCIGAEQIADPQVVVHVHDHGPEPDKDDVPFVQRLLVG